MSGAFIYGIPSFDKENEEMFFEKTSDYQMTALDENANNEYFEHAEEVEEDDSHVQLIDLKEEKINDPEVAPVVILQAPDDILMNTANTLDPGEDIELFYDSPASRENTNALKRKILKPIRCSVIKIGPLAKPESSDKDKDEIEEMYNDYNRPFSRSDEFLTGERPFQCPVCDSLELFFQGDKLTEHARMHLHLPKYVMSWQHVVNELNGLAEHLNRTKTNIFHKHKLSLSLHKCV
ncbi:unnamed protein product [Oikopleura dioica]|uniref:C2H2-type domain-containing protein n=1 Tax=Oikopleura dioica TaxID=34765 RepID=E4XKJ3_OIKDI|nr:unnamed protein product [Oikopleura dioica]